MHLACDYGIVRSVLVRYLDKFNDGSIDRLLNYVRSSVVTRIFLIIILLAWLAGLSGCSCSKRGAPPEPEAPGLYISGAEVNEGIDDGVTLLKFQVRLSPKRTETVTVDYASIDTSSTELLTDLIELGNELGVVEAIPLGKAAQYVAIAGQDFLQKEPETLIFEPGEQEKTLEFEIIGDETYEKNELLGVRISNATNADIIRNIGIGIILNDDDLPIARMTISEGAEVVLAEEFGKKTSFDITLEGDSAVDAVVSLTVSGSPEVFNHADVIGDFRISDEQGMVYGKFAPITIPAFVTSMKFTIEVIDDGYAEDNEQISMSIAASSDVIVHNTLRFFDASISENDLVDYNVMRRPINDSGQFQSLKYVEQIDPALESRLDHKLGRDADTSLVKVGAGLHGFDFTKLDENGNALADSASSWNCVRDNFTGLIWEVKQGGDIGIRASAQNFHWYDPDPKRNAGGAGKQGSLECGLSDPQKNITICDTQFFIAEMNRTKMCGMTGWRLPGIGELRSIAVYRKIILDNGAFSIDRDYFPNVSLGDNYLSDTTVQGSNGSEIWAMNILSGVNEGAELKTLNSATLQAARLVNSAGHARTSGGSICADDLGIDVLASTPTDRFTLDDADSEVVTDQLTGLMWMRCELGYNWNSFERACSLDLAQQQKYGFIEALRAVDVANNASVSGYSDWRMPNIKELSSIIEYKCSSPAMNVEIFSGAQTSAVWTNTPIDDYFDGLQAWGVQFANGSPNLINVGDEINVRLVRDP